MTAKRNERMLACITNGGGYFENGILDRDDDNDDE